MKNIKSNRNRLRKNINFSAEKLLITELCGGYEAWKANYGIFKDRFEKQDFGHSALNQAKLINIVKARKKLYDNWFGSKTTFIDYIPILLNQGAEYAAVGNLINKNYPNCLILGADHSALAPFYSINQFIPSVCLKRLYC